MPTFEPQPEAYGFTEPAEQLAYLRSYAAGQAGAIAIVAHEQQEIESALIDGIIERDAQIDQLETEVSLTEEELELINFNLASTIKQRDRYRSLSEQGAFGGLLNKNTYLERATRIVEHDRRTEVANAPKIVVFMDVDDLNKLNSKLTESVVDSQVLEPLAQIVASHRREGDVTGIWGGDEIAKLLQRMNMEQAVEYITAIRNEINTIRINPAFAGATDTRITLSIGIAQVREGDTYKDAETRAARAKEYAKEQPGKNAIINADDIPEDWVPTRKSRAS